MNDANPDIQRFLDHIERRDRKRERRALSKQARKIINHDKEKSRHERKARKEHPPQG